MIKTFDTQALELSRLAVLTFSAQGTVASWNRAAEELYGYPRNEALGRPAGFLCFPGERTVLARPPTSFDGDEQVERHRRRDGLEIFVGLRLAAHDGGLLVVARDVTEGRLSAARAADSYAALGVSRKELRRLAGRILEAQEHERRRIARELHDDFKQRLASPLAGQREALSFKAERQALAKLRHPNIGLIYEVRTTEDGDPYIVMEHVPGVPITEYCDRYRLGLSQRVELFVTICEAVQHIHQKGVLHRDLKPPNVLVMEQDGKPIPKIVDFGIAKGLDRPLAEGTVWSYGAAGTPSYISPEVLVGEEADTRSDVYSLGVILYELLAGVLPAELERGARDEGLILPSKQLSALSLPQAEAAAAGRGSSTAALLRGLRGDLDWIVAKTLAHEPEMRYTGAGALGEDLGRHCRRIILT